MKRMSGYYILNDHNEPVECHNLMQWGEWLQKANRIVKQDKVGKVGEVLVSTVFFGLDHSFGSGPPLLFETMIFGGERDGYQERCSTWAEAEKMHQEAMQLAGAVKP